MKIVGVNCVPKVTELLNGRRVWFSSVRTSKNIGAAFYANLNSIFHSDQYFLNKGECRVSVFGYSYRSTSVPEVKGYDVECVEYSTGTSYYYPPLNNEDVNVPIYTQSGDVIAVEFPKLADSFTIPTEIVSSRGTYNILPVIDIEFYVNEYGHNLFRGVKAEEAITFNKVL